MEIQIKLVEVFGFWFLQYINLYCVKIYAIVPVTLHLKLFKIPLIPCTAMGDIASSYLKKHQIIYINYLDQIYMQ